VVEHSKWKLYEDHDNLVRKFAWNMIRSCRVKGDNAPEPDLLAEADVCDEVATAIWNKVFKAYSAGNYKDRGYKITAWIGTIARNYCTDWVRVKKNHGRLIVQTHLEARTFPGDKDRRLAVGVVKLPPSESR